MNTVLTIIGIILLVLLLLAGTAFWYIKSNFFPQPEEVLNYKRAEKVAVLNQLLMGVDLDRVRDKADLILDRSVAELQQAVAEGDLTYEELTAFYLDRIRQYDQNEGGLNTISELNPQAIECARQADAQKQDRPLFGIPYVVKENINTNQMVTSAGTIALQDFIPATNAPVVEQLNREGAILLGKTNLSEMANFMDFKMPSGYSSKNGQTHNPFKPREFSPLGSSSGSGGAIAANFAALALGTETTGSIVAPAAIHSIVGFKPTKDTIDHHGVIPLSSTLDTVGVMTKSVADAEAMYNASVATNAQLVEPLNATALNGKRIGVSQNITSREGIVLKNALEKAGAIVIEVAWTAAGIDNTFIITNDLAADFASYAQEFQTPIKSLNELVAFNQENMQERAKYGQRLLEQAVQVGQRDVVGVEKIVTTAQHAAKTIFADQQIDAVVYLNNDGAILTCIAGWPELTVPLGTYDDGKPYGATFVTPAKSDRQLLQFAYSFEQTTQARNIPILDTK